MKATKVDKDLCIGCGLCYGIGDQVCPMIEQGKAEAYLPANAENQGAAQEGERQRHAEGDAEAQRI